MKDNKGTEGGARICSRSESAETHSAIQEHNVIPYLGKIFPRFASDTAPVCPEDSPERLKHIATKDCNKRKVFGLTEYDSCIVFRVLK
jgi:hypothetical protein